MSLKIFWYCPRNLPKNCHWDCCRNGQKLSLKLSIELSAKDYFMQIWFYDIAYQWWFYSKWQTRPNDNKTLTKIRLWACEAAQLTSSQKTRTHNNVEASEFDMYRINFENGNFLTAKWRNYLWIILTVVFTGRFVPEVCNPTDYL